MQRQTLFGFISGILLCLAAYVTLQAQQVTGNRDQGSGVRGQEKQGTEQKGRRGEGEKGSNQNNRQPTIEAESAVQSKIENRKSKIDDALHPTPYTLLVTLSQPVYRIHINAKTGAPQMPKEVTATAQAVDWPADAPLPTAFTWRVYLDWDYKRFPTHHDISNRTFTQSSPLKIDFGNQIRGGTLTVFARTTLNGQVVYGKARALVLADNPTRSMVLRAFPRTRFGLIASKIGMAESGLNQFTQPDWLDPGGIPVVSRTNDVGIMQLNVPSGSITSADQIWDWRANVERGLEILGGKQRTTLLASRAAVSSVRGAVPGMERLAYLNVCRLLLGMKPLPPPSVMPLSDRLGSGAVLDDPDVDHLKLSQAERDAIRRYNGGCEYAFTLKLDPHAPAILSAGWEIDPLRGGMSPTSGDPDYVRHVLSSRSGLTLPPPPKPHTRMSRNAKASHLGRHRHHRRHR